MTMERCAVDTAACIMSALVAAGLDARIDEGASERADEATTVLTVRADGVDHELIVKPRIGDQPQSHNVVYATWRRPEVDPRLGKTFDPLRLTHPAYHEPCVVCGQPLGNGKRVQLLALGPVTNGDRVAHYVGAEYLAVHGYCHEDCLQGAPTSPTE